MIVVWLFPPEGGVTKLLEDGGTAANDGVGVGEDPNGGANGGTEREGEGEYGPLLCGFGGVAGPFEGFGGDDLFLGEGAWEGDNEGEEWLLGLGGVLLWSGGATFCDGFGGGTWFFEGLLGDGGTAFGGGVSTEGGVGGEGPFVVVGGGGAPPSLGVAEVEGGGVPPSLGLPEGGGGGGGVPPSLGVAEGGGEGDQWWGGTGCGGGGEL